MKRKLLFAATLLLSSVAVWATDYLTDFSTYEVTKTAVSNDNTNGTTREFWRGTILNFDVAATDVDFPNGVYSFSVQALYRGHLTKDIPTGIIAYAESGGNQYMTPIANLTDGSLTGKNPGLSDINTAFQNDANDYLNTIPYIIVTDGKIKVGVKSMSTQPFCGNGMWFLFNTASFKVSNEIGTNVLSTALDDVKKQAEGLLNSNLEETSDARTALETAVISATATSADIVALKQKIDAYLAYLSEKATVENPYDVSYYFTNPKYSIRNLDLVGGLVTSGKTGALGQPFGWTCFDAGGTVDDGSGNAFQDGQGFNWFTVIGNNTTLDEQAPNYDADKTGGYSIYQRIAWNQWAEQTHSAKQTVTLPAGRYKLSVPAKASANNNDYKGYVIFTIAGKEYKKEVTPGSWNVYEEEFYFGESFEVSVDLQFNKLDRTANKVKQYAYFDGVTLITYGDPVPPLKSALSELQSTIDGYLTNADYNNVKGTERATLTAAKTLTSDEESVSGYETAIAKVQSAIDAFVAAKANYDDLVKEIAKATDLGVENANNYAATEETTAATALKNTQDLKVDEYKYVDKNYNNIVELGQWTRTGSTGSKDEQHWSGEKRPYLEQSEAAWGQNSWTIGYSQNLTLPQGDYVFKVAGRKAQGDGVTLTLKVTKDGEQIGFVDDFPEGDGGLGINKAGATSFDPNDPAGFAYNKTVQGCGFEWRYVKFTLTEDATVNVAVNAEATTEHMWVSFCDATVQTNKAENVAIIAYNIALNDANIVIADDTYENVTGSEKNALETEIAKEDEVKGFNATQIEEATNALNAAIAAFKAAKGQYDTLVKYKNEENVPRSVNIGDKAFQISQETEDELWADIETAHESINNYDATSVTATAADIQVLLTAYEDANTAYKEPKLNKPKDDDLFNIINVSANYDHANKALTFKSASNANLGENTTSMGWTEAPGSIYPQGVKFEPSEDGVVNGYIMCYERADGETIYIGTGISTGLDTEEKQIRPTTYRDKALTVQVVASDKQDVWYLYNTNIGSRLGGNGKNDSGFFTGEANGYAYYDMNITPAAEHKVTVNILNRYGTLIVPFDAEIPAGIDAVYSVNDVKDDVLTLEPEGEIKANTPYVIHTNEEDANGQETITLSGVGAAYNDLTYTEGLLTGAYSPVPVPENSYVLQTHGTEEKPEESVQAFYKVDNSNISLSSYRAYLTLSGVAEPIKALYFGFADDDATAIEAITEVAEGTENAVFYNLAGQRVQNPTKGIYIVNGKKVLVK